MALTRSKLDPGRRPVIARRPSRKSVKPPGAQTICRGDVDRGVTLVLSRRCVTARSLGDRVAVLTSARLAAPPLESLSDAVLALRSDAASGSQSGAVSRSPLDAVLRSGLGSGWPLRLEAALALPSAPESACSSVVVWQSRSRSPWGPATVWRLAVGLRWASAAVWRWLVASLLEPPAHS